jgi:hypothetical protein
MGKVFYGVIALTIDQANEVIYQLEDEKPSLVNWLKSKKDYIYGNKPEDWKPFDSVSIREMIETHYYGDEPEKWEPIENINIKTLIENFSEDLYKSQTFFIEALDNTCEDKKKVNFVFDIDVFFIDVCAIYLEKYREMAKECSARLAINHNCCFLINPSIPPSLLNEIEREYKKVWSYVNLNYIDGDLHRVAFRVEDLINFKNYILKTDKINPTKKAYRKISGTLNQPEKQSLPKF